MGILGLFILTKQGFKKQIMKFIMPNKGNFSKIFYKNKEKLTLKKDLIMHLAT